MCCDFRKTNRSTQPNTAPGAIYDSQLTCYSKTMPLAVCMYTERSDVCNVYSCIFVVGIILNVTSAMSCFIPCFKLQKLHLHRSYTVLYKYMITFKFCFIQHTTYTYI